MKKVYLIFSALLVIVLLVGVISPSQAKKWTITVGSTFNPSNLTHVKARDTIIWVWDGGSHSTTSVEIPLDALDWDEPIDIGNQSYTYIPTKNGTYTYKCTVHGDVTGHFTVSGASAGISETEKPGAKVYPNPFTDRLIISTEQGVIINSLRMFDLNGKLVYSSDDEKTGIFSLSNLGGIAPGSYIISFTTRDGRTFARRVIHN